MYKVLQQIIHIALVRNYHHRGTRFLFFLK